MKYNFDQIIPRKDTGSFKYDTLETFFGTEDLLPMWVADMDFRCADEIVQAVQKCVDTGIFGYGFRSKSSEKAFIDWVDRRLNWKIGHEDLLLSPGVVTALALAVVTYTKQEDHIVLMSPVYHPFFEVVRDHQRPMEIVSLQDRDGRFYFDWEDFEEKLSRSKMFLLCNPHNPGGRVWSSEELTRMGELCCKHDVIIISDEIHCDLMLNGHKHFPIASMSAEIAARCVTAMAPSKTFNIAGAMNSVVVITDESLRKAYSDTLEHLHLTFGNTFGHLTMEAAYQYGEPWLEELLSYLSANIDLVQIYFAEHLPQVKVMRPEASFLIWLDFTALGMNDHRELVNLMVKEAKVGLNSGTTYGKEGLFHMRMNIGCPRSVVQQALQQIHAACDNYMKTK